MKYTISAMALCAALAGCGGAPNGTTNDAGTVTPAAVTDVTQTESAKLNAWFDVQYEELLLTSPMRLTSLGRKERYGEWDDMSRAAELENAAWSAAKTAEMKETFDYDLLDQEAKMSYDLWAYQNDDTQKSLEFSDMGYVFDQMSGIHSTFPTVLINFHRVDTAEDMDAYISRVDGLGEAFSTLVGRAQSRADAGIRPPLFSYEIVIDEVKKLLDGAPFTDGEDNSLFADGKRKIAALLEAETISPSEAEAYQARLTTAMTSGYKAGYEAVLAFLEADIENATDGTGGVGALDNGEEYYNFLLASQTTTDLSASEIHDLGLAEVERIRAEMIAIKEQVEFSGTLQEFFAEIRDADWNYYPNTDEGRQGYIDDATAAIENIKAQLPNYFGILPKADLVVKRVEEFREQDGAAQHYFPGTPDGSRDGIYYAHLSDMSAMPKNQLEVIAYHEGLPGHHMQISIAQELTSVPQFRTQYFSGAYIEGWALYTEFQAKEIPGTYADPYADFGRLTTEKWRAIRLVVDTGLHSKNWTEQQAIEYFSANSPEPLESVRSEVRRYMVLPGQATTYKIGMLKIQELRAQAETELGDQFDIRGFHDAVLGGGSLPLGLLERRVDEWVASVKEG